MVKIISAMTEERVIGNGPNLPWKIPEELKFFKLMTIEQTLIMGSNTLESIGHLLPNRANIILSKKPQEYFDIYGDCYVFSDFDNAVEFGKTLTKDVYICGGANVYKQAVEKDYIHDMIISVIKKNYTGDVYFPEFHPLGWMAKDIIYETDSFITKRYVK